MGKSKKKLSKFFYIGIIVVVILIVASIVMFLNLSKEKEFIYSEHLSDVVYQIDGKNKTLDDLSCYFLNQEMLVEEQAKSYDAENTIAYWNLYLNGSFMKDIARKNIVDVAIHDDIYYALAINAGISLTNQEDEVVSKKALQFFYDLSDFQKKAVNITPEKAYDYMYKKAIVQKMIIQSASQHGFSVSDLDTQGSVYLIDLQNHKVEIHEKLLKKVNIGYVTIER